MAQINKFELAKKLKGFNTLKMIESALNLDRTKAIYLIHKLRKEGYVKTKYLSSKKRIYYISPKNVLKGTSYTEVINKQSPIKIMETDEYNIYGREVSIEEALIYALNKRSVRYTVALLGLFRKITSWSKLYNIAKKDNLIREVVALYDVARKILPKLKRMPKRFRNLAKPKKNESYKYIIDGFKSMNFEDIEKKWKVYIPLNWDDLSEYEGVNK